MKTCSKCKVARCESEFYASKGRVSRQCKECMRATMRRRYESAEGRAKKLSYQYSEPTKAARRVRKLRCAVEQTFEARMARHRAVLSNYCSGRSKYSARLAGELGLPETAFRAWIEMKFLPGMSWDNYGLAWQLDHFVPFFLAARDPSPAAAARVVHYTNVRPLSPSANAARSRRAALLRELADAGVLGPCLRYPCDLAPNLFG